MVKQKEGSVLSRTRKEGKENEGIEEQKTTDQYSIINGDSAKVLEGFPDEFVGLEIHSPPFLNLFTYSDSPNDLSNSTTKEDFFEHYRFIAKNLFRILMPGRISAVHCMDTPTFKSGGEEIGLYDFSGDIIRLFISEGFIFHSRHCVWKCPLTAATRTKAIGLAHKQIVKDSAICRTGIPDYILAFRKPGINPKPIKHPRGLTDYYGKKELPKELDRFLEDDPSNPYDPSKDKRSHTIWQRYASPVWDDIRQSKTLSFKRAKDPEDMKHICAFQTDVVYRCLELWSTKGDVVLDPFMGVGTVPALAVKMGRKGTGIELKPRYFRQAKRNLESVTRGDEIE